MHTCFRGQKHIQSVIKSMPIKANEERIVVFYAKFKKNGRKESGNKVIC